MSISEASALAVPQIVNPRQLGRPVHLLPGFAARFGADLGDFLRQGLNRRYGTSFAVAGTHMGSLAQTQPPGRWMIFSTPTGRIGLSIERVLVLRLLQRRYGLQESLGAEASALPVTASEERLARKLGLQFVAALVQRIRDAEPGSAEPGAEHLDLDTPEWLREASAAPGLWRLEVRLSEPEQGIEGQLCFSLDEDWMRVLLAQLARARTAASAGTRDAESANPLASRLKLRLVARLHQQRLPLADILALRVGDVLPVNLQDTDVLVKESRLFTASVAEHKGRLWLTAFNDI